MIKKSEHVRLWEVLLLTLLIVAGCATVVYTDIILVKDYNFIGFMDIVAIFQVERFIETLGHIDYTWVVSKTDYGSEFWFLAPFYRCIGVLFNSKDPLNVYYTLVIIHLCCGISALLTLWFLLRKYSSKITAALFFTLALVSSPILFNLVSTKPGPNITMFSLSMSLLFLLSYLEKPKDSKLWWVYFFSALAAALKWWGLFMVLPLTYCSIVKKGLRPARKDFRHLTLSSSLLTFSSLIILYRGAGFCLKYYQESGKYLPHSESPSLSSLEQHFINFLVFIRSPLGIVTISLAATVLLLIILFLLRKLIFLIREEKIKSKPALVFYQLLKTLTIFTSASVFINLPFLSSEAFPVSSIVFYYDSVVGRAVSDTAVGMSAFGSSGYWISQFLDKNYFNGVSLVFFTTFAPLAFVYCTSKRRDVLRTVYLFVFPLWGFIIFSVWGFKESTAAMMTVFLFFSILLAAGALSEKKYSKLKWVRVLTVLVFSLEIFSQISNTYTHTKKELERKEEYFSNIIPTLNKRLQEIQLNHKSSKVYLCKRSFPIQKEIEHTFFSLYNRLEKREITDMRENDLLVFEGGALADRKSQAMIKDPRIIFVENINYTRPRSDEKKFFGIFKRIKNQTSKVSL